MDDLLARHRAVLPRWLALYYQEPIEIVSGKGCRVTDADGHTYLDFFTGILTNMLGYDVPEVREAVDRQLATGVVHTSTLYLIRSQVELAEKIARRSGIPDAKVFFTASGTEANDTALLLATNARRATQVLALRNAYHGRAFSTLAVTGNRGWRPTSLAPFTVSWAVGGDRRSSPWPDLPEAEYVAAAHADLRALLATTTGGDIACLIAEPIQGVGGFTVAPSGLLRGYQEILDGYGALYISDEVQTGWGRTGRHFWGYEGHGVRPDLLTFAKGLGNGIAIGGVVARAELMDGLDATGISTFGGNPLATAAANAVLDYLTDHDVQANVERVGALLFERLGAVRDQHPVVAEVRGQGLAIGVELTDPVTGEPDPAAAAAVQERTRQAGLLVGRGGLRGNCLRIAPPLTLSEAEAAEGAAILADAIAATIAAAGR